MRFGTSLGRLRLLVGIVLVAALMPVLAADGPVIPKAAKGDACVADTEFMRRNHMELILHQRDETVIEGIRGKPFSLVDCVNCHASSDESGNAVRIDSEGQFCESCHTYAAVRIDCFSCHAAVPAQHDDTASLQDLLYRLDAVPANRIARLHERFKQAGAR